MNRILSKKEIYHLSQRLKHTLVQRFILCYLLYLFIGALAILMAYLHYKSRIWYGTEDFYLFVHSAWKFITPILLFYVIVGALGLGIYFLRRACRYLDEFLIASESLFLDTEKDFIFSKELQPVALYLNSVRDNLKNSQRLAMEAEQRKNDLVVYLAHDLKTPLTSVIGYLTLLNDEEEISPKLQKKYLGVALEKAERLEDLINEFFEITRFSLTHLTLELSEINLTRMLEQTIFEFQPMFSDKELTCELDAPTDYFYRCDPDKLQRVFDNLLRNAVNYSYPNSTVSIALKIKKTHLLLTVQNTGNTIPEEKLNRIFEQFFRLDTSRSTKSGGAGLGLAIAKEIVKLHGGEISAQSTENQVTFSVKLPLPKTTENTSQNINNQTNTNGEPLHSTQIKTAQK